MRRGWPQQSNLLPTLTWVMCCRLIIGDVWALLNEGAGITQWSNAPHAMEEVTLSPRSASPGLTNSTPVSMTKGILNNTYGCGNKTSHCDAYCELCGAVPRATCYDLFYRAACYKPFIEIMEQFNNTDLCMWDMIQEPYNTFTVCTEELADCLLIPWPNPVVEDAFVEIHTRYFQECPIEELRDPPPSIVFALVVTPICLIPAMVFLVVLKTKNGDGRS